jgi:hypothetical protein
VVGLLPPSQLGHIATVPYLLALLAATLLVGLLPPLLLHKLHRPGWNATAAAQQERGSGQTKKPSGCAAAAEEANNRN